VQDVGIDIKLITVRLNLCGARPRGRIAASSDIFNCLSDGYRSFLRKELLTVPQSAHLFGERFPIRSEKIEQVCLENALADAYAGNHVPRLLYRQASSE
jgi:hypothetical protein